MKDNKKNILSDLDKIISIYEQYMLELIENDPELHTKKYYFTKKRSYY